MSIDGNALSGASAYHVRVALQELSSREILQAVAEYDRLGQNRFLEKYGFGAARSYRLVVDGKTYDSKAIVGAAHGFLPGQEPLGAHDFSGGAATVGRLLSRLGFEMTQPDQERRPVARKGPMAVRPAQREIFLSYRRQDAAPYARLLQSQLKERFPAAHIFLDLDSIEPGRDFAEVIQEAIGSCAVLVTLIGRQWTTVTDGQGRRRLDDPDDYVRFEVQTALDRGVRVIPVLVDGAAPLRGQELPAGLRPLARLNALELSYCRYEFDANRLLDLIQQVLPPAAGIADDGPRIAPTDDKSAIPPSKSLAATNPARATRLLDDAERVADSITDDYFRAYSLTEVAQALAAADPARAIRLVDQAERLLESVTDESQRRYTPLLLAGPLTVLDPARARRYFSLAGQNALALKSEASGDSELSRIARAQARLDPERALDTARCISSKFMRASAIAAVAEELKAIEPALATQILDEAERAISMIDSAYLRVCAYASLAGTLTDLDPDRAGRLLADAERVAPSIEGDHLKASGLAKLGKVLVKIDPVDGARLVADAERAVRSLSDEKVTALDNVAPAVALIAPDRAVSLAQSIPATFSETRARTLLAIVRVLADQDPDKALQVARTISTDDLKSLALEAVAQALASTEPDQAIRIARAIPLEFHKVRALIFIATA
jgi:hypothetical protein